MSSSTKSTKEEARENDERRRLSRKIFIAYFTTNFLDGGSMKVRIRITPLG